MIENNGLDGLQVVQVGYAQGIELAPPQGLEVNRESEGPQPYFGHKTDADGLYPIEGGRRNLPGSQNRRMICGLRPRTFWTVVVVAVVVIVGAAVGGGVGGSLTREDEADSPDTITTSSPTPTTTTSTSTSTSTTPSPTSSGVTSGTSGLAAFPCPEEDSTNVTASGVTFSVRCYVDWPKYIAAADGSGAKVDDLYNTTAYTLSTCMDSCVQYNRDHPTSSQCKGVTYNANLTAAYSDGRSGNCFLKDRVGEDFKDHPTDYMAVSAGIAE